jgi:hypothetical protein
MPAKETDAALARLAEEALKIVKIEVKDEKGRRAEAVPGYQRA